MYKKYIIKLRAKRSDINYENTKHNKTSMAILMLGKADFKTKNIIREKERYSIMIKGSIP